MLDVHGENAMHAWSWFWVEWPSEQMRGCVREAHPCALKTRQQDTLMGPFLLLCLTFLVDSKLMIGIDLGWVTMEKDNPFVWIRIFRDFSGFDTRVLRSLLENGLVEIVIVTFGEGKSCNMMLKTCWVAGAALGAYCNWIVRFFDVSLDAAQTSDIITVGLR